MKVAAVQMTAKLGKVDENLKSAERWVTEAFRRECKMVVLPEFFPTAVGFHPDILKTVQPLDGNILDFMKGMAKKYAGYVCGSFIARRDGNNYNTWVLAMPDGSYATHDKDQPTMWENCYYIGGTDPGILPTPLGPVGVAMCWEMVRTRTAARLRDHVDLVIGGSCWWDVPNTEMRITDAMAEKNLKLMKETPSRLARLIGTPVIHAAHAGDFECRIPYLPFVPYRSHFLGETQIVDANGNILVRRAREEGEGLVVADIELGRTAPSEALPKGFWIPRLPIEFKTSWWFLNFHGRRYYRKHIHFFNTFTDRSRPERSP
jgi:N-carbamoylputrescine amidase